MQGSLTQDFIETETRGGIRKLDKDLGTQRALNFAGSTELAGQRERKRD
jgi:hypothetical protein